jgi:hypothetical protein
MPRARRRTRSGPVERRVNPIITYGLYSFAMARYTKM